MAVTKRPVKVTARRALDSPKKLFRNKEAWAGWLDRNHHESAGLWLQIAKKGSKRQSVTYAEAVEVALCYGWIDGQKSPKMKKLGFRDFYRVQQKAFGRRSTGRKR